MSRFNTFPVSSFVTAAMLVPGMARAMDIVRFDQMTNQDQQAFLDSLSGDAEMVLNQEGRRRSLSSNRQSVASATLQLLALVLLTACTHPAAVAGADSSQTATPAATDAAAVDVAGKPPFITDNPDGTFTIQKQPSKRGAKDTKDERLIIPPQVVVPLILAPEAKRRN